MKSPLPCTATLDSNYCLYYLDYSLVNYLTGLCECALDSNPGFCRYPNQEDTLTYIKHSSLVHENDHCHTLDRENMKAQLECGLGDCENFRLAV